MRGGARPTLDTVAQAAGVSRMTVSNAYNRPDQISGQTREKVLRIAAELGYAGPDPAARSLRRGRAGTVGVLLTERLPYAFADPGMLAFLHGVATELADSGQAVSSGMLRGLGPDECLCLGSAVGASCVQAIGTTTGVFTREQCDAFLTENPLRIERL